MVLISSQLAALSALYFSAGGSGWTSKTNWLNVDVSQPCDWYGITCDDAAENVIEIDLEENNLIGSIPTEIGLFAGMTSGLGFQKNSLFGSIPSEIGLLSLISGGVFFQTNSLSGPIPSQFGKLTKMLSGLQLDGNQLTSSLPSQLGQLVQIGYVFWMGSNQLTGLIPSELGRLTKLSQFFCVVSNGLTGSIPSQLGRLNKLASEFDISSNSLCGDIPEEVSALSSHASYFQISEGSANLGTQCCLISTNKHDFSCAPTPQPTVIEYIVSRQALSDLYHSTQGVDWHRKKNWLEGHPCANEWYGVKCQTLTDSVNHYADVTSLELMDNSLRQSLPTTLGLMSGLQNNLRFEGNSMSGTIPSEMGMLTKMSQVFYLWGNSFEGTLPSQLGQLTALTKSFKISSNRLTGELPSQLGQLTAMNIEFRCVENSFSGVLPSQLGRLTAITGHFDLSSNQFCGPLPLEYVALESQMTVGWGLTAGNSIGTPCPTPNPTAMPIVPTSSPTTDEYKQSGVGQNDHIHGVHKVHIAAGAIFLVLCIAFGSLLASGRLTYMLFTDNAWQKYFFPKERSSEPENKTCFAFVVLSIRRCWSLFCSMFWAVDRCLGFIAVNFVKCLWCLNIMKQSSTTHDQLEESGHGSESSEPSEDEDDEEEEEDYSSMLMKNSNASSSLNPILENEDDDEDDDEEEDPTRAGRRSYLRAMGIRRRGDGDKTLTKNNIKKKKKKVHSLGGFVKRLAYGEKLIPKARKKTVVAMEMGMTTQNDLNQPSDIHFEDQVPVVETKSKTKYNF